ncbi:MAG: ATP-binding protein [Dehalococcoidia bacterium]|nr:ATP-binding protein [Dehalococcoidia bacterium]
MIEVSGLTFTYAKGSEPAIAGLDFAVERGEVFGFLGPSGAGKSTTQRILIGLLREYQGQVTVLGKYLADWHSDYYESIGVSPEFPNHFLKLTALENLRYFSALYSRETQPPPDLLAMVGLEDDGPRLVSQYSKGMKQRLSVARSLLHNPELLFLDEPTAGLDPLNARRIMDLIKDQQKAGKTVFLTTHNMTVAEELCDRVAFITAGRIVLVDAPRELKLRYGQPTVRVEYVMNGAATHQDFALEGLGTNADFLSLLRTGAVQTIHTQEATLEAIFIQVTGRSLQ